MNNVLSATIYGEAHSKGSKRAVKRGDKVILIEDTGKGLQVWESRVVDALVKESGVAWVPRDEPCACRIDIFTARPKSHYGTGKNAARLKESAPERCGTRPDVDKVQRALLDCVTDARWWTDDSRVDAITVRRHYDAHPRVTITVSWEDPQLLVA